MEALADVDGIVKSIVFRLNKGNHSQEDLISEGRLAAWLAIEKFDSRKEVKLKTFVFKCVENRIKNIQKFDSRRPNLLSNYDFEEESFDDFDLIDLEISAQMILSSSEYDIFTKYRAGFTFGEIADDIELSYTKVRRCFIRICQKLRLHGTNQI